MAKVKLDFGAEVDFLTREELHSTLGDQATAEWSERARGIKRLRFTRAAQAAVSATAGYTIPHTPNQGYTWSLRSVAVSLSTAQTVQFYLGSDTNTGIPSPNTLPPLGSPASNTIGALQWGSGQQWLDPGDYIVVSAGGAATLNSFLMYVIETPTELIWKLT